MLLIIQKNFFKKNSFHLFININVRSASMKLFQLVLISNFTTIKYLKVSREIYAKF